MQKGVCATEPRLTQEEYRSRITEIASSLEKHIGRKVLLVTREGRNQVPIVATLERASGKILARYVSYAKDGSTRGTRTMQVDPLRVYAGDVAVEYFDDGI